MAKGKNLRRLAELLNCRPGWLLGEEEQEEARLSAGLLPQGKDVWQQRALAAEKKLAALRTGLRVLLETSADLSSPSVKLPSKGEEGAAGPRAQE